MDGYSIGRTGSGSDCWWLKNWQWQPLLDHQEYWLPVGAPPGLGSLQGRPSFKLYLICSLFDLALDVELLLQVVDLLVERGQGLGFISGQETRRVDLSIWKIKNNNSQEGYFSQEPRMDIKLFVNFVLELITTIFHLMEAKQHFDDLTCRTIRVRRNIEITARLVWDTQIPL